MKLLPILVLPNALIIDFDINYKDNLTKSMLDKFTKLIKEGNLYSLRKFLYENQKIINTLITLIPFSILLKMNEEFNFMNSYESSLLYNVLSSQDYYKLCIKDINKIKVSKRMINISEYFNIYYNFARFTFCYDQLRISLELFNLNLNDFYVDTNFFVFSCCNFYKKNTIPKDKKIIKLYPKKKQKIFHGDNYHRLSLFFF